MIFVRVNSHRARHKMFALIGEAPAYFSWDRWCTGGFYAVTPEQLERIASVTGITRARNASDLHRCINFGTQTSEVSA